MRDMPGRNACLRGTSKGFDSRPIRDRLAVFAKTVCEGSDARAARCRSRSSTKAAASRLGSAVGAALTNRRALTPTESRALAAAAILLLIY